MPSASGPASRSGTPNSGSSGPPATQGFTPQMSLLARDGAQPVGFVVCDDAWIVQVGTHPAWRGRGLGAALVVEALRRFAAAGAEHVTLDVNTNNPGAARVYTRLGFEV